MGNKTHMRVPGTQVLVDVLESCVQKGIRRGNNKVAIWGAVLMCRAGHWMLLFQKIIRCILEDSNGFVDPSLTQYAYRSCQAIIPLLSRRGVTHDTPPLRRHISNLLERVITSHKSRLATHASIVALSEVAHHIDVVKGHGDVFNRWKAAYTSSNREDALRWTAVIIMNGLETSVWKYLLANPHAGSAEHVETLWKLCHTTSVNGEAVVSTKVPLYEAVLCKWFWGKRDVPVHAAVNNPGHQRYWDLLFSTDLKLSVRHDINWEKWLPVILDIETRAGQNQDTLSELIKISPSVPEKLFAPDHPGMVRASPMMHHNQIGTALENCPLDDDFRQTSETFQWDVERGRFGALLSTGYRAALPDSMQTRLADALGVVPKPEQITALPSKPKDGTTSSKRSASASRTTRPRSGSGSQINLGGGFVRSVKGNGPRSGLRYGSLAAPPAPIPANAMRPLPGMLDTQTEDVVHNGPTILEDVAVSICQMTGPPQSWKPLSWICILDNNASLWIKTCSELKSTIPVYLDRIKVLYGLRSISLRWADNWLVGNDIGKGGPYKTVIRGARKWPVIDQTDVGFVPVASHNFYNDERVMDEISRVLFFRAIFGIPSVALDDIYVTHTGHVFSTREMAVSASTAIGNIDEYLFGNGTPTQQTRDALTNYWTTHKTQLISMLSKWDYVSKDIPPPPRPLADTPRELTLCTRIHHIIMYLQSLVRSES